MATSGQNRGFHVLDDFVCQAVPAPSIPLANPANQGRNEGMAVMEEVVFEAATPPAAEKREDAASRHALDDSLKTEAQRLAAILAASADPLGAVHLFQKLLAVELAGVQKTAAAAREKRSDPTQGSGF